MASTGGREWSVDLVDARNVTVRVLAEGESAEGPSETLADLAPGEMGRVLGLSPACRGQQRRRLLDLGVVKGTEITAEMVSAAGDPVAYLIRGALIALRRPDDRPTVGERVDQLVQALDLQPVVQRVPEPVRPVKQRQRAEAKTI